MSGILRNSASIYKGLSSAPRYPMAPTVFTSVFTVNTISGDLSWTDNSGGTAQYEIYSNTNGAGAVLLTTTIAGATSYSDLTCKQNASVVYSIRAKKDDKYSDFVLATALITPLCWKTNQSTLTQVKLNSLDITTGKTVNVNWGDGNNANYTGVNSDVTHDYASTGQYNIILSGDTNYITKFSHILQSKSYGVLSNWILPLNMVTLSIGYDSYTGKISENSSSLVSSLNFSFNSFSDSNITVFGKALTAINISSQNVAFSTVNIDKFIKSLADYYEDNAPTSNCTFTMNGANMGIPTGGASNVDLVRLAGYYTSAGKTATILIRTS